MICIIGKCIDYKGSPTSCQNDMNLCFTNGFKQDRHFYPPYVHFVFYFIARLRRRTPANWTQPNFAKRWMVNRAQTICRRTVAVVPRKKLGAKNLYIFSVFRGLRHLMANIFWTKRDIDNGQGHWKVRRVSYVVQKFHELWSANGLKRGPEFLPTLTILFRPSPSHTLWSALTWRPTATLNETALGSSVVQIWSPKRF